MGYESRIYIGRRFEVKNNRGETAFIGFTPEAVFNLGKVNSEDFRQNSKLFNIPIDFELNETTLVHEISYDRDTGITTGEYLDGIKEDRYGEHICYCDNPYKVMNVIGDIIEQTQYSLYKRVYYYLQSLCCAEHEDFIVVHYGY